MIDNSPIVYRIVSSSSHIELIESVNRLLADGWSLQGGVCGVSTTVGMDESRDSAGYVANAETNYYQAMTFSVAI